MPKRGVGSTRRGKEGQASKALVLLVCLPLLGVLVLLWWWWGWRQRQMRAWRARSVAGVGRKQQGRRYQQPRDRLRKM